METQECSICKKIFPLTLDYFSKHSTRGLDTYCKPCRRKKNKENYYKNKEKWNETSRKNKTKQRNRINEFKDPLSCLKCGESRNHLLDFHHIDPQKKKFQISQGERYGWEKIKKEIEKCVVLCSNCHRDFHYQEKENGTNIEKYLGFKL